MQNYLPENPVDNDRLGGNRTLTRTASRRRKHLLFPAGLMVLGVCLIAGFLLQVFWLSAIGAPAGASAKAPAVVAATGIFKPNSATYDITGNVKLLPGPPNPAVVIGDSQSAGGIGTATEDTWTLGAVKDQGFYPKFIGAGGIGYATNGGTAQPNYVEGMKAGTYLVPSRKQKLVILQGGGNDVRLKISNEDITKGVKDTIRYIRTTYPQARIVMVGTLAKAANDGGGRRNEVNALLAKVASDEGLEFIDVGDWMSKYNLKKYSPDGVHLDPKGHGIAREKLREQLQNLGVVGNP